MSKNLYYIAPADWLGNFYDSKTQDMIDIISGKLKPKETPFRHSAFNFGYALVLAV